MTSRIAVTGMGIISPAGNSIPSFLESLRQGRVCRKRITKFDLPNFPVKWAYEVEHFDSHQFGTHLMDPFIQYAVAATHEAVAMSRLDIPSIDPYRIGISVSSSKGGVSTIDRFKDRFQKNPSAILGARIYANSVPNFAAQWIARRWELQGPAKCYVAACATGIVSIIEGARMVADGVVDYCIAGASDASIVPLMLAGYYQMKALDPDTLRPFDKRRKGFMAGEGAGIVILEKEDNAKSRGAKIYGTIAGSAYGADAHHPIHFDENEHALEKTIRKYFNKSSFSMDETGYINLHGTGTPHGDIYETREIKRAFEGRAAIIPMSSIKSMTGHMLGASGAVQVIASLLAMEHGFLPPTATLEQPDPECDLDYVPIRSRKARISTALNMAMGFGGHIAILGLSK